jgi:hypothetical protein
MERVNIKFNFAWTTPLLIPLQDRQEIQEQNFIIVDYCSYTYWMEQNCALKFGFPEANQLNLSYISVKLIVRLACGRLSEIYPAYIGCSEKNYSD